MAKSKERLKARKLRRAGSSINEIAEKVNASKSSISRWCRDVELIEEQRRDLLKRAEDGAAKGRLKWAKIQKQRRLTEIRTLCKEGIEEVGDLNRRDFFLTGVGLYWTEGFKSNDRCGFINSDPEMVCFLILWMKTFFDLEDEDFYVNVDINIAHKERIEEVEKFWSDVTGIPVERFRNPSYKRYKLKKKFENFENHYGSLRVYAKKGTKKFRKIRGWIEGLKGNFDKKAIDY
ncbi:MAG: hypothetical protein ACOC6Q_00880 [Patescibacteria group bacterium]